MNAASPNAFQNINCPAASFSLVDAIQLTPEFLAECEVKAQAYRELFYGGEV